MMTFHDFVSRLAGADTPAGDFCSDYLRKPCQEQPKSWRRLRDHLGNAPQVVIDAARSVWDAYRLVR